MWEVEGFICETQMSFSVLLCYVVLGKTAKVLWYMNPKAEMEESASGSRSSLFHGVFQHDSPSKLEGEERRMGLKLQK